jgi:hypothetical protein
MPDHPNCRCVLPRSITYAVRPVADFSAVTTMRQWELHSWAFVHHHSIGEFEERTDLLSFVDAKAAVRDDAGRLVAIIWRLK